MKLPPDWVVPDWPVPSRVHAFVTARSGGVSCGDYATFNLGDRTEDDAAAVAVNKARLRALLPQQPRWLSQVHGARVVCADEVVEPVQADAAYTASPGTVCAVKVADCMPIFFADAEATTVGICHAGWRGLSAGVVENTVAAMPVKPAALHAFLGPAIGADAFEVGDEVRAAFCAVGPEAAQAFRPGKPGKWMADLFALARQRLARCGVERIHGGGLCTWSNPARFYSHRRNPRTGRMAALIWLDDRDG